MVTIANIQYGLDPSKISIHSENENRKITSKTEIQVPADGRWIAAGKIQPGTWTIDSLGTFQIDADSTGPWECTANGITIEYYRGNPLGRLMAVIIPDSNSNIQTLNSFLAPVSVGSKKQIRIDGHSSLYFKINDNPLELENNSGQVNVTISKTPGS